VADNSLNFSIKDKYIDNSQKITVCREIFFVIFRSTKENIKFNIVKELKNKL
jgi:hypothetical protein